MSETDSGPNPSATARVVPPSPMGTHLADVIQQNILSIERLREQATRSKSAGDRLADAITTFAGSMVFVYVHLAWFGLWIVANSGRVGLKPFDPFPYGLLTMIVSLEAIFLSTFVLISQNRLAETADRQAHLDLQIGLLTEHEVTKLLRMVDAIERHLGIETVHDPELMQLEAETHPEEVLAEIVRVERQKGRTTD